MSLTSTDVLTLARLTQLQIAPDSLEQTAAALSQLTGAAANIPDIDTGNTAPMITPLDMTQRLRPDVVSEPNQRELYQSIAPATENGLYLVPKVLD